MTPGIYRHYKGGTYRVLNTARMNHCNADKVLDGVTVAVYIALADNTLHVRPVTEFFEDVTYQGRLVKRFTREEIM